MHIKHLLAIGVAVIGTPALPSFAAGATLGAPLPFQA